MSSFLINHRADAIKFLQNSPAPESCQSALSFPLQAIIISACCLAGIIWAVVNCFLVLKIDVQNDGDQGRQSQGRQQSMKSQITNQQRKLLISLGGKIADGAKEFLKQQYLICLLFVVLMFIVLTFLTQQGLATAVCFLIGALVSILCGSLGMLIATKTNFRVTFLAKNSLQEAFRAAYRAGCVIGFALVSLGLIVLLLVIIILKKVKGLDNFDTSQDYFRPLFQAVAGYGLGGSFVALFGRVGGGIYTKAADVGADLVGKVQIGLPQDSPYNPATIADNVGDNVGDVAGMSADLFGSFAESTCAALVISSDTLAASETSCPYFLSNLMYPLLLIAFSLIFCILVSLLATHFMSVQTLDRVQWVLKLQIVISTIGLIGIMFAASVASFPASFELNSSGQILRGGLTQLIPWICSLCGLIAGMIIAGFTQYVTSHSYGPVRQLSQSCKSGAASNITLGLALGYSSTLIPTILIAVTAFVANRLMGYYGVALAALGMLANLPLSLAIDGYGPISDNAGGIAEMASLGEEVRARTDGLDAAGNTTAAIGKGFAIGSAALVSLSLYGGFLHNAHLQGSDLLSLTEPSIFAGLLVGAMLPYLFSAFTIKSVGRAAQGMVSQVRRQIRQNPGILNGTRQPDYNACIAISTRASLYEMIVPGLLVIVSPLAIGFIFGPKVLAGFIPGSIISAVQLAISAANTGGAWDNAKKYIQSGALFDDRGRRIGKGSPQHKASIVGDTVGDPLKDTSGPALNILMKIMAIISLIFGSQFAKMHSIGQPTPQSI